MDSTVNVARELGKVIKENRDTIEIEGKLGPVVIRIKAVGNVAWGMAIGAIAVALVAAISIPASGGASTPLAVAGEAIAAPVALSVLGIQATTAAIAIAVAGGGIGVLSLLRKYRIVEKSNNRVVLLRK